MQVGRQVFLSCLVLLCGASVAVAADPNEKNNYVSRQEYETLKKELDEVRARLSTQEEKQKAQEAAAQSREDKIGFLDQEAKKTWQAAQSGQLGETKLLITGDMNAGYVNQRHGDNSFFSEFSPMLLWQLNERLFFEGGLDFDLSGPELDGEGSGTDVELGAAYLTYLINDYASAGLGYFPLPFTEYHNHFDASWINKLPTDPLVYGDNGIAPDSGLGAFATGSWSFHGSLWNYAVWVTNGPTLITDGDSAGQLNFGNYEDTNNNKAVGGRIGYLPIPWFQVGFSLQYSQVDPSGFADTVDCTLYGVDWDYVQTLACVRGQVTARGGWIWSDVGTATYPALPGSPRFDNNSNGGYAELAYRPTKVLDRWLRNVEFVGRYDRLDIPSGVPGGGSEDQWTGGVDYWITPRTVVKAAYTWDDQESGQNQDLFALQVATGF
jgi:hypothetical protein